MAELWELVLHHSYSGTPGVIFDQSPARACHGRGIGLSDDDFVADGVDVGTGAVRLGTDKAIRVEDSKIWHPCRGVMVEMVIFREDSSEATLVDGLSYGFGVADDYLWSGYGWANGGGGGTNTHLEAIRVPVGEWITLRWSYDGMFNQFFWVNGELVQQSVRTYALANTGGPTFIGARQTPAGDFDNEFHGLVDDVKIWRTNPHKIDDTFTNRPMDPALAECWRAWVAKLTALFRDSPDCAKEFNDLLQGAFATSIEEILKKGEPLRSIVAEQVLRYNEAWVSGRLDQIPAVLADLLAELRRAGIDPLDNDDFRNFQQSSCVGEFFSVLGPPDCDPDFVDMMTGVQVTP
jgi:concanavalin A-like lectin/glucanase superfamily protein